MAANLGMLMQFLAAAGVTLWIFPAVLLRAYLGHKPHPLASVTLGLGYWIASLWILAWVHSVELATLVALAGSGAILASVMRRRQVASVEMPAVQGQPPYGEFLDALESGGSGVVGVLMMRARHLGSDLRKQAATLLRPAPLLLLASAGASFYEIVRRPLGQVAPGAYHGYLYLLSGQQLAVNQGPFVSGVFPEGGALLAALWSTLLFQNPLNVWRFLPLVSAGILLGGAGYLAYAVSGRVSAAIMTVTILGISAFGTMGMTPDSPDAFVLVRLGLAFVPLTLAFALAYWKRERPLDLAVVGSASFVAVSFEPWAGVFLLLPVLMAALFFTLAKSPATRPGWRTVFAVLGGAAFGIVPLMAGLITGTHLYSFLWDVYWPANLLLNTSALLSHRAFPLFLIVAVAVMLLLTGRRDLNAIAVGAALVSVVVTGVYTLLRPGTVGADLAVDGQYLALLGVPVLCGGLASIRFGVRMGRVPPAVLVGLSILAVAAFPPRVARLVRAEPVGSGRTLIRISQQFPAYQWTLVSPGLQYSEVLGRGWHVELSQFVRAETLAQARNSRYRLRANATLHIETPVTLVYIALRLPGLRGPVTARDASLPLSTGGAVTYRGKAGAAVEGRALVWAKAYLAAHPKSSSVYYRNADLLVVEIQQPGP